MNPFHMAQAWPHFFDHSDRHNTRAVPDCSMRSHVLKLERVYLFTYEIVSLKVGWFLVYLIITNPYSDRGNESTFQKMANHLTTKQYYFSGYLLALLPKKWFQASLPISLNLNFFHKASSKKKSIHQERGKAYLPNLPIKQCKLLWRN